MKRQDYVHVAARLSVIAVSCFTSFYCLCAYITFTYQQVIKGELLPELTTLARIQPYLYCGAVALLAFSLYPDLMRRRTRIAAGILLSFLVASGAALLVHPLLTGLQNDRSSLWWSFAALTPMWWLTVIDWLAVRRTVIWGKADLNEIRRLFWACVSAPIFVTLLYSTVAYVRLRAVGQGNSGMQEPFYLLLVTAFTHLLIFMLLFVMLSLIAGLSNLAQRPLSAAFKMYVALGIGLAALAFRKIVLTPLSFTGPAADAFSLALAIAVGGSIVGLFIRFRAGWKPATNALALLINPFAPEGIASITGRVACIVVLVAAGATVIVKTAALDWSYLVQEIAAAGIWLAVFASFYAMTNASQAKKDRAGSYFGAALAVLGLYAGLGTILPRAFAHSTQAEPAARPNGSLLERYSGYNVSLKLTRSILSPPVRDTSFYQFLAANTNIPRSTYVKPVEVNLVDPSGLASAGQESAAKINIFIIVIDSLRRDYVSPYNPAVNFTPAIDSFARESVVMQNAFTRYGGTGLSEPSIWVGGMLLHKQYVTPFAPMNTMQKLLAAEGYHAYISRDSILNTVVAPSPDITELDRDNPTMTYDLSRTLAEVEDKIEHREDRTRPIFLYTQPQNIHTSVINREKASVPAGEAYPGFYAPYAARLKQMDKSFGEFIDFLKNQGLYENSVVILTADHGDSLGEDGRWGHAYTLFPEVVRIPLIVHLPPTLQRLAYDKNSPAFLTDITPSLYYILGKRPVCSSEITGRPLFTEQLSEQNTYRHDSYLLASSYGAVYGILSDKGSRLYIADGVNYTDYLYDLSASALGVRSQVPGSVKRESETLIRRYVQDVDAFYGFSGKQEELAHDTRR
ncbi:MAG TPA: sulfatase-like hydrolase/transferase [Candidatus Angelobacter sp.]|nr:sulfatase-like hydrolase/transferase [Candidatus Angelobacter sp.]